MKNLFGLILLSLMFATSVQASDLFSPTLGIKAWSGDTTLKGFSNRNEERFRHHHKKQMTAYEKERGIKLFSVVGDNTRFG